MASPLEITSFVIATLGVVIGAVGIACAKTTATRYGLYASKLARWQVEAQRPMTGQEKIRHPGRRDIPEMPPPPKVRCLFWLVGGDS